MKFTGSFNSTDRIKFLKLTYMVTIALLLSAVILTPIFIKHHLLLFKKYVIQEDAVEAALIIILILSAYLLSDFYKKELKKYRQEISRLARDKHELSSRLNDAFKYIGSVNVEIQEIRSIFCGPGRYPKTQNALKADLALFARKLLAIVNVDWLMIRIIRQNNLRTMKEQVASRKNGDLIRKGISNKAIVARRPLESYRIVTSHHDNSVIMVACVFPAKSLAAEEKILSEAVANQIEMLYMIFISAGDPTRASRN